MTSTLGGAAPNHSVPSTSEGLIGYLAQRLDASDLDGGADVIVVGRVDSVETILHRASPELLRDAEAAAVVKKEQDGAVVYAQKAVVTPSRALKGTPPRPLVLVWTAPGMVDPNASIVTGQSGLLFLRKLSSTPLERDLQKTVPNAMWPKDGLRDDPDGRLARAVEWLKGPASGHSAADTRKALAESGGVELVAHLFTAASDAGGREALSQLVAGAASPETARSLALRAALWRAGDHSGATKKLDAAAVPASALSPFALSPIDDKGKRLGFFGPAPSTPFPNTLDGGGHAR